MTKHGGKRKGAGRPKKADEVAMIERMDAILAPDDVWQALADQVAKRDTTAVKTWLAYRYGQPKQTIEADHKSSDGSMTPQSIDDFYTLAKSND